MGIVFIGGCCFVAGVVFGICVKLSWLAHSSNGAVSLIVKIDTDKLK